MRYPPQFIDALRGHFRLSDVIGKRIPVKKHGREYSACCPFHNEKTPSFTINDEKGFFHCFGCGAHGDVIGFVKDYHKISYPETIERLAAEAGMPLPELTPEKRKEIDREEMLQQVMASAAQWFVQQLFAPNARHARDYVQRRGLREDVVAAFGMGYAPEARQGLHQALLQRDIAPKIQEELGLIVKRDDGSLQDKFRDRIQFPIHNLRGAVIGFGGRKMKSDAESSAPKYLNSPDTPLFKKSYMLYNAHRARKAAVESGQLIIAEGYMDVIGLAQAGFAGAVAPLGTAVTPEQLKMAWGMVDEPVLCLDGDNAGERAMLRAAELALPLLKPSKSLRFCVLPKGEDPDSLIQKQGRQAMAEVLQQTIPLVDIIWKTHFVARNPETPEQKAGAERDLLHVVGQIADESVRGHYQREMKDRMRGFGQRIEVQGQGQGGYTQHYMAKQEHTSKSLFHDAKKTKSKRAAVALPLPAKLPATHDVSAQLERCYLQMLTLIVWVPALLEQGAIENALGHMQHDNALIQALKAWLLSDDLPDIAALTRDHIIAAMSTEMLRKELQRVTDVMANPDILAVVKEKEAVEKLRKAMDRFLMLQERAGHIMLQQDYRGAAERLRAENSEDALKQFYEVTQQVRKRHQDVHWYGDETS